MREPAARRARLKGQKPVRTARPCAPITTILVDDHTVIRQGVRVLLDAEPDIEVIGEAEDGRSAVAATVRQRPRVVVMDIAMPLLNGLEATRQILAAAPSTRVLILSAHNDPEYVTRVLELGAAGYILKQSSLEDLATAIRTAAGGGIYVSPSANRRRRTIAPVAARPTARLTAREAEVLQLVAEGHGNKQTAAYLRISVKTVEKHRSSLMAKLDIHDVAGLTRHAIAIGTIQGRGAADAF